MVSCHEQTRTSYDDPGRSGIAPAVFVPWAQETRSRIENHPSRLEREVPQVEPFRAERAEVVEAPAGEANSGDAHGYELMRAQVSPGHSARDARLGDCERQEQDRRAEAPAISNNLPAGFKRREHSDEERERREHLELNRPVVAEIVNHCEAGSGKEQWEESSAGPGKSGQVCVSPGEQSVLNRRLHGSSMNHFPDNFQRLRNADAAI